MRTSDPGELLVRGLVRAPDGIVVVNDGVILFANPAWAELHGCGVDEVMHRQLESFREDDEAFRAALTQHGRATGTTTHRVARGGAVRVREWGVSVGDSKDAVVVFGARLDSDERAQAEQVGAASFLDSVIENIPNMIFVKDAEQLRFVRFNRAGEDLLGYERADLVGKSDRDFFPASEADAFIARDRAVLRDRRVVDIPEEPIHVKSGGLRWLHTKKIPICDPAGKPLYLLGISEDITDRKLAEERLRATRARVEMMAEASAALVSSDVDAEVGRITAVLVPRFCDASAAHVVDNDQARLMATNGEELALLNESAPAGARALVDALRASAAQRSSSSVTVADIQSYATHVLVAILIARGRPIAAFTCARGTTRPPFDDDDRAFLRQIATRAAYDTDTARLQNELVRALHARDEFLTVAAHELRTPVTAFRLQLESLARMVGTHDGLTPERVQARVERAAHQAERLSRLVEGLLDVARMSAGHFALDLEDVSLRDVATAVVERMESEASASGCMLHIACRAPHVRVRCDRVRIEQVLVNLIANAVRYVPGSPIDVDIDAEGQQAMMRVRDRGQGIPADLIDGIFDRYERGHMRGHGGLGVGLYITRQIVRAHQGTITVESSRHRGSTFTVMLPRLA